MPGVACSNQLCLYCGAGIGGRSDKKQIESSAPMSPPEEFLKHAAECELMAKFARKREDKESWRRMAERWLRCADQKYE